MNGYVAIIYEGDKTEENYWNSLWKTFFHNDKACFISFPAGENIYMLWKQLKDDDFNSDIIEVVREYKPEAAGILGDLAREDFQEVYLFFDYDPHNNNLSKDDWKSEKDVLRRMLQDFNNETENGKLYISYPMSEALRDYTPWKCKAFSKCFIDAEEIASYKELSGLGNPNADYRKYDNEVWQMLLMIFIKRCTCLLEADKDDEFPLDWYKSHVSAEMIYDKESDLYTNQDKVFPLSAFPEFILDYFKKDKLEPIVGDSYHKVVSDGCDMISY